MPILERFALPLALCFILIGAARIAGTYRELSITIDEPYHFRGGLEYLTEHVRHEIEQPPLEQAAGALLPLWNGARLDGDLDDHALLRHVLLQSGNPWRVITLMRAGVLPFFLLAALAVFFGARRHFGGATAVLSTALFTLIPPVLAHAGVATTDIAVTATITAAFFVLIWWAERPTWTRAIVLGAAAALAILSKFSALLYLPAAAGLALAFHLAVKRTSRAGLLRMAKERAASLAAAAGVCALAIWAGYWFSFGPVPGWHSTIRVPAPQLFDGLCVLAQHNREGHGGYLLGEFGNMGWWYFFPVALAVKTPVALLILTAIGLFDCWQQRRCGGLLPVALCLGILLPALPSHINIGVRHVLPIYSGMAVIGGLGVRRLARWLRGGGVVAALAPAVLIGWMAVSGAHAHPDYLGYFNEFAADRPDDFLMNSDFDWDQDLVLASHYLHRNGALKVWFDLWRHDFATNDILSQVYGFPAIQPPDERTHFPSAGWHIISASTLRSRNSKFRGGEKFEGALAILNGPWYERVLPTERIGGLLLYNIPKDFGQ